MFDCLEVTEQIMLDFARVVKKKSLRVKNTNFFIKLAHILAGKKKKEEKNYFLTC